MKKSEYKLLVENWRSFINEESSNEVRTVGDLKKVFLDYKKSKTRNAFKTLAKKLFLDAIPGGSQVKSLADFFVQVTKLPDNQREKVGTFKVFDIDDNLDKILKKELIEGFILSISQKIQKFPDDKRLDELDMNELLGAYIKQIEAKKGLPQKFVNQVGTEK